MKLLQLPTIRGAEVDEREVNLWLEMGSPKAFAGMPVIDMVNALQFFYQGKVNRVAAESAVYSAHMQGRATALSDVKEAVARVIYMQWRDVAGYVPWVEGGNSTMQDSARRLAAAAISTQEA